MNCVTSWQMSICTHFRVILSFSQHLNEDRIGLFHETSYCEIDCKRLSILVYIYVLL